VHATLSVCLQSPKKQKVLKKQKKVFNFEKNKQLKLLIIKQGFFSQSK
jgi:hypothetical protein